MYGIHVLSFSTKDGLWFHMLHVPPSKQHQLSSGGWKGSFPQIRWRVFSTIWWFKFEEPGSWFWCRCTVPSGTSGTSLGIQFLRWWKLAPLGQQSTGDQSTTVVPSTWVRPPWGTKHDPICRIVGNLSNLNSWKVTWIPKMMVFKMHLLSSKEV